MLIDCRHNHAPILPNNHITVEALVYLVERWPAQQEVTGYILGTGPTLRALK